MPHHYLVRYTQEGSAAEREAGRGEHIAYRKGLGDGLLLAGPLLSADGQPSGSVIIIAAEDDDEALRIASGDPYAAAGLLKVASVERMRIAAMKPPAA